MRFYKRIDIDRAMRMSIEDKQLTNKEYTDLINNGWKIIYQNYIGYNNYILLEKKV